MKVNSRIRQGLGSALLTVIAISLLLGGGPASPRAHANNPGLCVEQFHEVTTLAKIKENRAIDRAEIKKIRDNIAEYTSFETSAELLLSLLDFAEAHQLPVKTFELGPEQRRVKRVFVAIDADNQELVDDYLNKFNLDQELGQKTKGTLPLEFSYEKVDGNLNEKEYVTGVLRPTKGGADHIYRWGKKDLTRDNWWQQWVVTRLHQGVPVYGYSHLLGLSKPEIDNVKYFLDHPDERGFCKSTNCVAWLSGIELGKTQKGVDDESRQFMFSQLGIARASAHFEILRRLIHAANDRHVGLVVFVKGNEGYDYFRKGENLISDIPKTALPLVVRGLEYPPDSDIMKAIKMIPDGAKIFVPIAAGASPEGIAAIVQNAASTDKGYDVHMLVNGVSEATINKGLEVKGGKFRVHALFLGGNLRKAYKQGRADVVPGYLSDFTRLVRDPEQVEFHYDAIIVRVAPKDAQGRYSLGPNNDMIMTIIKDRPDIKVIAEVNPTVPNMQGDNFLTDEQITAKFESRAALAGPPKVPLTPVEAEIGKYIGAIVPSSAYLQMGIGNVFDGVPNGLRNARRNDLKVWTEMFGDPLFDLVKFGLVNEVKAGFAYGSGNMYMELPNYHQKIKFIPTEEVNDPGTISKFPGFHAINTALQVNLRGDTNATHGADGVRISSPGGQVEFMSGAARSAGGKAIIAIRSTAKNGELSTIVLDTYGGMVTTPHESVTHVVTEYGIATLIGRSESQRVLALINVAHPKFRAQLRDQALQRRLITPAQAELVQLDVAEVAQH